MNKYHDLVKVFQAHNAAARQYDGECVEALRTLVDALTVALHWNGGGVSYKKIDPGANERRVEDFVVSRDGAIRCEVEVVLEVPLSDGYPDKANVILTVMLSMRRDAGGWFVRAGAGDEAPCDAPDWVEALAARVYGQTVDQAIRLAWFPLTQG